MESLTCEVYRTRAAVRRRGAGGTSVVRVSVGSGFSRTNGISGVLVGRGVLRNPWILAQAADLAAGRTPRLVTAEDRGQFLLAYMELLLKERVNEADGFRHVAPGSGSESLTREARGRERWVINKIRALSSWYSKGFDNGSHYRTRVNSCESIAELRAIIEEFFFVPVYGN